MEGATRGTISITLTGPYLPSEWSGRAVATGESAVLGYVTLAVVVGLLLFGLSILLFLRPRGGPEVAFARLLADSRRRTNFLIGLCTSLAALFAIGLTETVALLVSAPPLEASVVLSTLFGVGAIGIFVLMTDALNTRPMTLAEE